MVCGFGVRDILISLDISLNKKVYRQLQFHCNVRATPAHLLLISPSELKKKKLEHFHLEICALDLIVIH